jgi:L-fuconate dehydratase
MIRITAIEAIDVRYPTSRMLDGSAAINPAPDYSAAYGVMPSNVDGLYGHGMTFTIGRGNELCVAAINALAPLVIGATLEEPLAQFDLWWVEEPVHPDDRATGRSSKRSDQSAR